MMSSSKQRWHAPWKLHKVISDNVGDVRCCTVEKTNNRFFFTGSDDGVIKIWDLHSGILKDSLTNSRGIRGLELATGHPEYLYSCGEGGQVKCWDVERKKVFNKYRDHVSTVNSLAVHFVLTTVGRDYLAKSWDLRSSLLIHTYSGHAGEVLSLVDRAQHDEIITGSRDCTVRIWELTTSRSMSAPTKTLIDHRKSVKALALNPTLNEFVSASQDSIKKWTTDGKLIQNLPKCNAAINSLAVNEDDVLVSGTADGKMQFWDWPSGHNFQTLRAPVRPGSSDSETDIFSVTFDASGTRLITTGADKMIKIYKEDKTAPKESLYN